MNSKTHGKCQFALKLIQLSTISIQKLYKNANFVNLVHYGKLDYG